MTDETLDGWLDEQIQFAENELGMLRSYRKDDTRQYGETLGRRNALKEVKEKLAELWGAPHGETGDKEADADWQAGLLEWGAEDAEQALTSVRAGKCGCWKCFEARGERPWHMVVCRQCGNKRCPHAHDHRNACTGSNDPGQPGSAYT